MLTIRPEQLEAFSQVEVEKFEEWMLVHLRKFFPAQCQAAGESQLRGLVRTGIKRAAEYQITSKRDVCKFIDLMVVFGLDFDKDNLWARDILAAAAPSSQKMWNMYKAEHRHLKS